MPFEVWSNAFAHPAEEVLEEYCFSRLQEPALSALEEHLFLCQTCRTELEHLGSYISLMKAAAADYRDSLASGGSRKPNTTDSWLEFIPKIPSWPRLTGIGVAGMAVVLLSFLVVSPLGSKLAGVSSNLVSSHLVALHFSNFSNDTRESTVLLTALRGGSVPPKGPLSGSTRENSAKENASAAEAGLPAGKGFAHANSHQPLHLVIDPRSLPGAPGYRLALVDTAGVEAWIGSVTDQGNVLSVNVAKSLNPGVYWARLYSGRGELLREFGLRLD